MWRSIPLAYLSIQYEAGACSRFTLLSTKTGNKIHLPAPLIRTKKTSNGFKAEYEQNVFFARRSDFLKFSASCLATSLLLSCELPNFMKVQDKIAEISLSCLDLAMLVRNLALMCYEDICGQRLFCLMFEHNIEFPNAGLRTSAI